MKKGLLLVSAVAFAFLLGETQQSNASGGSGNNNGYYWTLYYSGGSASIGFGSGGNYNGSWNGCNDVIIGKGWNPGGSRNIGYNVGALSGTYKFWGIYGWTTSPLIEYYVAEKGSMTGGTYVNSVSSDGHSYSFYKQQRVNQPSIVGTATFWQYKDSWGGSGSGNHTVTMGNHINNWRNRGGQGFGSYNLQVGAMENWSGGSGYVNATVW
jgi:endo-1,4-beta-xylanase